MDLEPSLCRRLGLSDKESFAIASHIAITDHHVQINSIFLDFY